MLERIEHAAQVSVARACSFALLGIATAMVGMSGELQLAFKSGGLLLLMTTAVLVTKALHVPHKPYRSTEVWLMLRDEDRPSAETAQQIISGVLREVYIEYARLNALAAALLLGLAIVMHLKGMLG